MSASRLRPMTGEFIRVEDEAAFQRQRFPETVRHARLVLGVAFGAGVLLLLNDLRIIGEPIFPVVLALRLSLLAYTVASFRWAARMADFPRLERLIVAWQWLTGSIIALIVYLKSNISLPISLVLPVIFYLAVPVSFRWRVLNGSVGSLLLLLAYATDPDDPLSLLSMGIWVLVLNAVLILLVLRDNRMARLSWCAIEAERAALASTARSHEMVEKTFLAAPIPMVVADIESGRILRMNEAGQRYFQQGPEDAPTTLGDLHLEPDVQKQMMENLRRTGEISNFEARIGQGDAPARTALIGGSMLEVNGRPAVVAGLMDITDRLMAEDKVRQAALHDALTGLSNRAAFQLSLEAACAAFNSVCLLLVDLDSLKDVNDTYGHDAGDALLVETARRLGQQVEERVGGRGFVARLGGDEFVVLLAGVRLPEAIDMAETLIAGLRAPIWYGGRSLIARASVGVAERMGETQTSGELMKNADLALYAAKSQGRNRAVVYAPQMRWAMQERVALHSALTEAASSRAIVPFYQPKVSLVTGRVVGFEALMRWRRGPQAFLAPAAFASAFQDPELAVLVGDAMIQRVAADVRQLLDRGVVLGRIALNLSPAQFTHTDVGRHLLERFDEARVGAEHFDVEVTETVFLGRRADHVRPILDEICGAGMHIALDDFGTGYAALSHLKQLPIDTLKIDQSFVLDVEADRFDAAIVCSVIELGRNLGLQVVAEGVETIGQARFLAARGCEVAQGFLYAHPMSAEHMADFLAAESDAVIAERLRALDPA
ncbi:putative sensory box/GGDEF family protein [Azorhizobium caulinodans ORS 571]|uniref:Putative sensory box/GGDEF family protein n=1 Tax=Azorhizobium caulinodans (strain ATCC 43989 / DSM 5975 / JCM 20966 / LMG 6465 / NBRC 14845 / NCIMB 13405 / ORS 571) TaxID=438753 RepID=A8HZ55_AZOC5|nr:bifunctional diguanylate cyclase/phosphodiesterase [Azorhizobium caulinodans]BAF90538.1 putative sensory box/GGDEF family protein [Azorhizobium caulinodans ORS 571]